MALELRDRVVGSGPAQQAMLSEGSDPAIPPYQPLEKLYTIIFYSYTIPICLASIFHKTRFVKISSEYQCHG